MNVNNKQSNTNTEVNKDSPIEFERILKPEMSSWGLWFSRDYSRGNSTSWQHFWKCSYGRICAKWEKCKWNSYSQLVVKKKKKRLFPEKSEDAIVIVFWLSYETFKIISFGKKKKKWKVTDYECGCLHLPH